MRAVLSSTLVYCDKDGVTIKPDHRYNMAQQQFLCALEHAMPTSTCSFPKLINTTMQACTVEENSLLHTIYYNTKLGSTTSVVD